MKKQITSVSLVQTAKVAAAIYFVLACVGAVFFALASLFSGKFGGFFLAILAPFIYAAVGFVFVFIGAWVYNLVAKRVGGIEFTLTDAPAEF
jgi:hypothetical protein